MQSNDNVRNGFESYVFLRIIPLLAQSVEASFAGCSSQFDFVFCFCLEYTLRNVRYTVRIKKKGNPYSKAHCSKVNRFENLHVAYK